MINYREKIEEIIGAPVMIRRYRVESYMSKTDDEGSWYISAQDNHGKWNNIAAFTLICMPGCCGIAVSTNCWVADIYRGLGLGTLLNDLRQYLAYNLGYGMILCTDVESNVPQQKILKKNGWKELDYFTNPRTGNNVNLHCIHIRTMVDRTYGFDAYVYAR